MEIFEYGDEDSVLAGRPGWALLHYLASRWFGEIDLWRAGDRGIVVEIGQVDKEEPLQLMLVVGELGAAHPPAWQRELRASFTAVARQEIRVEPSDPR